MTHVLRFVERLVLRDDLVHDVRIEPLSHATVVTGGGYDGVSTLDVTLVRLLPDGGLVWVVSSLIREVSP